MAHDRNHNITGPDHLVTGSAFTVIGVNSSGASLQHFHILASDNTTVVKSGTAIYISATTTPAGAGGGSGLVNAGSAGNLAYYALAGTAVDDLIIGSAHTIIGVNSSGASHTYYHLLASNNSVVTKVGTALFITANTADISGKQNSIAIPLITGSGGTGRTTVGSAHTVLGVNSDGTTLSYYAILASDNATIVKSGTGIFISATTAAAGGSGTVQTGSENALAFYPSLGTTVSGSLITLTDGAGIAPFNLPILTAVAANSQNGDFWIQSSANRIYLFARSNNANYFVAMNT